MKTADHLWTDPSADELVQRHRIHGIHCRQDSPTKRPALCVSRQPSRRRAHQIFRLPCLHWAAELVLRLGPLISYLRPTDPEAELQQQHGRASLPLPVGP